MRQRHPSPARNNDEDEGPKSTIDMMESINGDPIDNNNDLMENKGKGDNHKLRGNLI